MRIHARRLCLSALALPALINAQSDWNIRQLTSSDGLPQNSVLAMSMDSLGFLWLATESGLVRYDGLGFRRMEPMGGAPQGDDRMRQLLRSPDGTLTAVGANGSYLMIHAHHLAIPVGDGAPSTEILGGIPELDVFVRAMDPARPFPARERWRGPSLNMFPLGDHDWCVAGRQWLYLYSDSALADSVLLPTGGRFFAEAAGQVISIDSAGQGMIRQASERSFMPMRTSGWPSGIGDRSDDRFLWRSGDPIGLLLSGGVPHIVHIDPSTRTIIVETLAIKLPTDCRVMDALWDPLRRQLLVGTDTRGLLVYRPADFSLAQVDGTQTADRNVTYAVVPLRNAFMAFNASQRSIIAPEEHNGSLIAPIRNANYTSATLLPDGSVAFASRDSVMLFDAENLTESFLAKSPSPVTCLWYANDSLWFGAFDGIHVLVNGTVVNMLTNATFLPDHPPIFIRRGPDGLMWFGTCTGLFRLDPHERSCQPVVGTEGLCVRTMETIDGHLFIGTYGNGPLVIEGNEVVRLPTDVQNALSHVHSFRADGNGYLWMSTNRGLFRTRRSDIDRWLRERKGPLFHQWFGGEPGLIGVEFNGGCDPSCASLANGMVAYPTMQGLVRFYPERVPPYQPPSDAIYEHGFIDGHKWAHEGHLILPAGTREFRVPFSLAYWGDPHNLNLEYGIDGEEGPWYPLLPQQREVVIQNPTSGEHYLMVRAVGSHRPISDDISLWFRVEEPFYKTRPGMAVIAIGSVAMLALLFWLGARRLRRRNTVLEEAVAGRTLELSSANTELQRTIELKDRLFSILSHDIVSPLKFITRVARGQLGAAEGTNMEERRSAMQDLSFASEKLYSNAQNLLNWIKQQEGRITLQPRHVVINLLVEEAFDRVRAQATAQGLQLLNDVPLDDVLLVDRDLLSIALNNLLINAVSYTQEGMVRISSSVVDDTYHLIVKDTGPGFSPRAKAQIDSISVGKHRLVKDDTGGGVQGLGYIIISGVMELLGGNFEVVAEAGRGTTIVLNLPVNA